jgi:hypothetical protein
MPSSRARKGRDRVAKELKAQEGWSESRWLAAGVVSFTLWVLLGRANPMAVSVIFGRHIRVYCLSGVNLRRRLHGVLGLPLKMGASCALSDSVTSVTEYSLPVAIGEFRSDGVTTWIVRKCGNRSVCDNTSSDRT